MINYDNMLDFNNRITPEYVAGLFDGEGCVSASLNNHGNMRLRVTITQKNPCILYLIMLKFPGTLQEHQCKNSKWHSLVWTGSVCIKFLEYIKNHVIIKHDVVESGLKLAQLFLYNTNRQGSITELVKKEKEELMNKITSINQSNRGKDVVTSETLLREVN